MWECDRRNIDHHAWGILRNEIVGKRRDGNDDAKEEDSDDQEKRKR